MAEKRYFWLKLDENFFNQREIQLIRKHPNGAEIILYLLQLRCESLATDGELSINDGKEGFTNEELSVITSTDIEIVKKANALLERYGFMKIDRNNVTNDRNNECNMFAPIITMDLEGSTGSESAAAVRMRRCRKRKKAEQSNNIEQENNKKEAAMKEINRNIVTAEREKEKEKQNSSASSNLSNFLDKEIEGGKKFEACKGEQAPSISKKFNPPTVDEIKEYVIEKNWIEFDAEYFFNYYESQNWKKSNGIKLKSWQLAASNWNKGLKANRFNGAGKKEETTDEFLVRCEKLRQEQMMS
jgi:hypothetical protein